VELGRRARVLLAVPLAAAIAVLTAHAARHPASQTHHVIVAAARGLDPADRRRLSAGARVKSNSSLPDKEPI
jgi:hypothetical protein